MLFIIHYYLIILEIKDYLQTDRGKGSFYYIDALEIKSLLFNIKSGLK